MRDSSSAEAIKFVKDCLNYLRFHHDLEPAVLSATYPEIFHLTPSHHGVDALLRDRTKKLVNDKALDVAREDHPPTLEDVRKEFEKCHQCRLCKERKNIVFGVGNEKAKLVFIGEAPGRDEDLKGEPFVGRAGQLLTKIINAMGLKREDVYITNIIKCRPPGNRNPLPDEIAACEPYLIKQLEVINPRLICALGTVAAQILLKTDKKISILRGQFYYYQGIRVLPTFHPAFLLRNPEYKRVVWDDMQLLMKEYEKLTD